MSRASLHLRCVAALLALLPFSCTQHPQPRPAMPVWAFCGVDPNDPHAVEKLGTIASAVADYEALYAYVKGKWGVTKVLHLSQSMGGLSGLNTIAHGVIPAHGWAGIFPVCSLSNMFGSNAGTYASSIRAAYGIAADGSDYSSKTSGYDPMLATTALFSGVPMRFYASAADTVVTKTANTDAFVTKVASVIPEEGVVVCTGNHGDASHFQPSDVLAFFARCVA